MEVIHMKALIKILTALAALVGVIYAIATYGEEIVAWARAFIARLPKCPCCKECGESEEAAEEAPVEESPAAEEAPAAEETPAEEPAAEEAPAEDAPVEAAPTEPVADDGDFAE